MASTHLIVIVALFSLLAFKPINATPLVAHNIVACCPAPSRATSRENVTDKTPRQRLAATLLMAQLGTVVTKQDQISQTFCGAGSCLWIHWMYYNEKLTIYNGISFVSSICSHLMVTLAQTRRSLNIRTHT